MFRPLICIARRPRRKNQSPRPPLFYWWYDLGVKDTVVDELTTDVDGEPPQGFYRYLFLKIVSWGGQRSIREREFGPDDRSTWHSPSPPPCTLDLIPNLTSTRVRDAGKDLRVGHDWLGGSAKARFWSLSFPFSEERTPLHAETSLTVGQGLSRGTKGRPASGEGVCWGHDLPFDWSVGQGSYPELTEFR